MPIHDVLLALTTYPDATPPSSIDEAVGIAASLGAKISAVACEARISVPGNVLGGAVSEVSALATAEARKSAAAAEAVLSAFERAALGCGVFQDRILEHCLTSQVPQVLVEHARLHDLTIVPVPQGDSVDRWYAELVIFGSGRPTSILPHAWRRRHASSLGTVVVAWDFSRTAARAIADARAILQKAREVRLLTVTNEKNLDTRLSATEVAKHLARHGIEVVLDLVDAAGRRIGDVLAAHAASHEADMLVMGAYGHSRLREFILGGATARMLSQPPLPVLMSH